MAGKRSDSAYSARVEPFYAEQIYAEQTYPTVCEIGYLQAPTLHQLSIWSLVSTTRAQSLSSAKALLNLQLAANNFGDMMSSDRVKLLMK